MIILSTEDISLVDEFLALLHGHALSELWRYMGYQAFEFTPLLANVSDQSLTLAASCEWRITGPKAFSIGSWNFGAKDQRFDSYAFPFYEMIATTPLRVVQGGVDFLGCITICLDQGFQIDVCPTVRNGEGDDQWRLERSNEEGMEEHLVLEGERFYRWVENRIDD